jgi:hypothetical protein
LRLDILGKAPFFQLVGIEFEKTSSSATAAGFFPPHRPVDQVSMRGYRVQNKYTINFNKKIQEAMLRAGLSYKGKALS